MLLVTSFFSPLVDNDPFFADVQFLSGFEGTNGQTVLTDESNFAETINCQGTGVITTALSKFGDSCVDVSGNAVITSSTANGASFTFPDEFTIEGWFRSISTAGGTNDKTFISRGRPADGNCNWMLRFNDNLAGTINDFEFLISTNGSSTVTKLVADITSWPGDNTFHHVAVDFDNTTYRMYFNGVVVASATGKVTMNTNTGGLWLGRGDEGNSYNGQVDEVRITKGVARYAGAFSVPTEEFSRG